MHKGWIRALCCLGVVVGGCGAVYPEMKTPVRPPTATVALDPPPPDDFFYFYFQGAQVPNKTLDGRPWVPNPYAKLIVDGKVLLETPTESATNKPTWSDQRRANYRIGTEQTVLIEVWDDSPITDHPICTKRILHVERIAQGGPNQVDCDTGARVWLGVEPAHALLGVGLYYELRGSDGVRVTRVVGQSPAERAGLGRGDLILSIQNRPVQSMDALQVRSIINSNVRSGLQLDVLTTAGLRREIALKEGAIYPLAGDDQGLPSP